MNKANDLDVFEMTRKEVNNVIAYLGKRPAEETFHLLSMLINRSPARFAVVEETTTETATTAETAAIDPNNVSQAV